MKHVDGSARCLKTDRKDQNSHDGLKWESNHNQRKCSDLCRDLGGSGDLKWESDHEQTKRSGQPPYLEQSGEPK